MLRLPRITFLTREVNFAINHHWERPIPRVRGRKRDSLDSWQEAGEKERANFRRPALRRVIIGEFTSISDADAPRTKRNPAGAILPI